MGVAVLDDFEDDGPGLIELVGPGRVFFGSDRPHAEGLAEPASSYFSRPSTRRALVRRNLGQTSSFSGTFGISVMIRSSDSPMGK